MANTLMIDHEYYKETSLGKRIYFLGFTTYHTAESSGLEAEQNPLIHRFRLDC